MPPGTCHLVITAEHSLTVGGHFYCKERFIDSLYALTILHIVSNEISNEDHSTFYSVLHRLAVDYADCIVNDTAEFKQGVYFFSHLIILLNFVTVFLPQDDELSCLVLIIAYLDQILIPSKVEMKENLAFQVDHKFALKTVLSSLHFNPTTSTLPMEKSFYKELKDAHQKYLMFLDNYKDLEDAKQILPVKLLDAFTDDKYIG